MVEPGSPIRLSDYGRQLAEKLNASEWARETAPKVQDRVQGMEAFREVGEGRWQK